MRTIVITGAANGLGKSLAEYLAERGWRVFALDFNEEQLMSIKHTNIIPIQVDVTSDEKVQIAFNQVQSLTKHLDAIVNFAGVLVLGSAVEVEPTEMMRIMNVNLGGTYRINKAFFELLLPTKGRIINISSETGVLSPAPFSSFYYMSKRAIEIYSDALRRELRFLGLKVIKVRPGAFQTNMQGNALAYLKKTEEESKRFSKFIKNGNSLAKYGAGNPKDPMVLAKKIERILLAKNPKIAYNINTNKLLKLLSNLPESLQDYIYFKVLK